MQLLADAKANLNFMMFKGTDESTGQPNDGWCPIHLAARAGDVKGIEILAQGGANLEIQLDSGSTPLALAAVMERLDVTEALLSGNADPESMLEDLSLLLRAAHAGQTSVIKQL